MNRFRALVVGGLLGSMASPAVALGAERYAYVDLQRALEETDDGKKAKAQLKGNFDRKQKELDAKQEELKKLKEDFEKKSPLLKPEAAAKAQKDMQDRVVQLQETYTRLQRDLAAKEQEATRDIFTGLVSVVGKIAEREHFAMVFERNASVVWGQPSLDITNEVIRVYNSTPHPSSKGESNKK